MVETKSGLVREGSFADGPAVTAGFNDPVGLAFGADGTLFVADKNNQRVRSIKGGIVATLAGTGMRGNGDGLSLIHI